MSKTDKDTKTPRESGLKGSQEQSIADFRETGACGNGKANVPDLSHTSNKVTGSRPSVEPSIADFRETGACGNGKANVPDVPHTSEKATGSRPLIERPVSVIRKDSTFGKEFVRRENRAPDDSYDLKEGHKRTPSMNNEDEHIKLDGEGTYKLNDIIGQSSESVREDTTQTQCMRQRDASGDENDGASLIGKTFGDDEKQNNGQVDQCLLPKDKCNTILTLDLESEKNKETDCVKTPKENGYTYSMQSSNWVQFAETDAIVAPVTFASNDRDLSAQNGDNEREVRTNVLRQTGISSETPTPLTDVLTVAVQSSDAPNDYSLDRNEVGFAGIPSVETAAVYNGRSTEADIEVDNLESPLNVFEDHSSCLVCQRSTRNAVIRPCDHLLFCWNCIQMMNTCWRCGGAIVQKIRINTN